jgi:hypothetical protein
MGLLAARPLAADQRTREFITRRGDQLFEAGAPFRFISFNIPNLQLVEDNFAPGAKTAWAWPDEFELADALESVRQMGGTVVRTYVLSVRREGSDMGDHVHVRGPGEFNEEAFKALDLALEVARRKGIRLIIPLVDNWKWQGGRGEYAAFRGREPDEFWTDQQVIADFEQTVRYVLGRVNSRTGVAYRDDPAILGWETGNELDSPPAWTRRIAALLKELDPNHLVIDGHSLHGVAQSSLDDPNVDVITTHHYPDGGSANYAAAILAACDACRGKKPYFVGEFGFAPLAEVERTYEAVIKGGASGALLWSLRFHHRGGGFYWHSEPAGARLYKAYHWPGFDSGRAYEERQVLELTRRKAYEIRGIEAPGLSAPAAPTLLPTEDAASISWQGSAGAREYVVSRSTDPHDDAAWQRVGDPVDDTSVQYRPLFNDESVVPGERYYYRVHARRGELTSPPSNVVGPVDVRHRTLVDECGDLLRTVMVAGGVQPTTGADRRRREDVHRLAIPPGGAVAYEVAAPIASWRAILFRVDGPATVRASYSEDGVEYQDATVRLVEGPDDGGDYGYLQQVMLESTNVPAGIRFLLLSGVDGPMELSRMEIRYDAR